MLKADKFQKKNLLKEESYKYSLNVCLNPEENGGQSVILSVDQYENDQIVQIETMCYGTSSSSIVLSGVIDLQRLIDAANLLSSTMKREA